MKLVKSLLLGSVAGLATVAGVQAADLPSRKAAPVEYVRVCSAEGVGFFYIPGTETCLRVGGRVRADYLYVEPFARSNDVSGFRARARLNIDTRTNTAYGKLRAFWRIDITANSGSLGSGTGTALDKAFIQWAGITAGRAQSFFDFFDLYTPAMGTTRNPAAGSTNLLAYTATFGGGFSATISLEDPVARRTTNTTFANAIAYGGSRMPDVVASLNVDQAWGSAQIAGAVHQIYSVSRTGIGPGNANTVTTETVDPVTGVVTRTTIPATGDYVDTEYGFAIKGGLKINLPMIAAGDEFVIEANYAEGAISYLGGAFGRTGGVFLNDADAYVDASGNVKKTKGYSIAASFLHYWTPQIRQAIFGSYARLDYAASVTTPFNAAGVRPNGSVADSTEWRLGTNVFWRPVSGFDIGVEVLYVRLDPRGRIVDSVNGGTTGSEDAFEARLRFQRDF